MVENKNLELVKEKDLEPKITWFSRFGWTFVIVGSFIFIHGVYSFFTLPNFGLNELGDYLGGTVGSLWALAGLFFIYVAFLGQKVEMRYQREELGLTRKELESTREELKGQRKQMVLQNENLRTQNFENTFFQLLKLFGHISSLMIVDISKVEDLNKQEGNLYTLKPIQLKGTLKGKATFIYYQRKFYAQYLNALNDVEMTSGQDYSYSLKGQKEILFKAKRNFLWDFETELSHYFNSFIEMIKFIIFESSNRKTYLSILRAQLTLSELKLLCYYLQDKPELFEELNKCNFFHTLKSEDLLLEEHLIFIKNSFKTYS